MMERWLELPSNDGKMTLLNKFLQRPSGRTWAKVRSFLIQFGVVSENYLRKIVIQLKIGQCKTSNVGLAG